MITCFNCNHTEPIGALFCSECGGNLIAGKQTPVTAEAKPHPIEPTYQDVSGPSPALHRQISLHILDHNKIIPLSGRTEYTLGRFSKGQPIMPDVDFTPFKAYKSGVSRLHASIKINGQEVSLRDLESTNGTYINDQLIPANEPHLIKNGDIISLGTLKIQVLITNNDLAD
ncbi:MAG: FHA domain-containing protein [Chloroflexota bacterium]